MPTSTTSTTVVARRKDHKGGRVLSKSLLWMGLGLFVLLAAVQVITFFTSKSVEQFDKDVVNVTNSDGNRQPVSPKIVVTEEELLAFPVTEADYAVVWRKLDALAAGESTPQAKQAAITAFLDGAGFKARGLGGAIYAKATGKPVKPATVECYLNGYVPSKPYLKANCPAF